MKRFVSWLSGCAAVAVVIGATVELVAACGAGGSSNGGGLGAGTGNPAEGEGDGGGGSGGGGSSTGGSPGGGSNGGGATSSGGAGGAGGAPSSGGSGGGSSSGGSKGPDGGASASSSTLCLMAGSGDYSKTGPYSVSTMSVDLASTGEVNSDGGVTTATIFYPTNMEAGCSHPIAAWGNGTGVTGSSVYGFFNSNVASWGIVVIAADNPDVAAQPYLHAGIDYLLAQNKDSSSVFYQKLGTKAGVAGHSQGGFAATEATTHPNVVCEVCVEGGGVPKQGVSTLCLTGNQSTSVNAINAVNVDVIQQTYPGTTGPGFLGDWDGGDHVTTPTESGWIMKNAGTIQFVRLMTAWYRCFLANDPKACALFQGGSACGICGDPGWAQIESKNIP